MGPLFSFRPDKIRPPQPEGIAADSAHFPQASRRFLSAAENAYDEYWKIHDPLVPLSDCLSTSYGEKLHELQTFDGQFGRRDGGGSGDCGPCPGGDG
jgi:hypothetical protein